jgi:acetolactate synthase-1/2/3 large subunit
MRDASVGIQAGASRSRNDSRQGRAPDAGVAEGKMSNKLYGDQDFTSEAPINLPANRQDPEYGSDVLCDLLRAMDFDYVLLTPGSSFRGLHDSLVNYARNHRPQIILCGAEEIALHMAQGYAKLTGKAPLVVLHNLVGLQHAVMGFYNAWVDRQPIVVLGGSGPADPTNRRPIDWTHSANTQCEIVRPYTKWTDEPATLQATVDSIVRAQRIANSGPKGPVYVSIDAGLQEDPYQGGVVIPDLSLPRHRPAPPMAAPSEAVSAAADLLVAAEMPLVFGGRFGTDPAVTAPLTELVELTGAAYKDAPNIVCLPTSHSQNLSGGFGATRETEILGESDCVLGIDCHDLTGLLGGYSGARGTAASDAGTDRKVIDLSLNDLRIEHWSNVGGGAVPYDVQLLADPLYGLRQLVDELKRRAASDADWQDRVAARRTELAARHDALRARQREGSQAGWEYEPISVPRMLTALWEAVKDKNWLLTLRNGRSWYEGIWDFPGAGRLLGDNGGGGVGYGPGGVIGSALAARGQGWFCVSILGDGDFTMNPSAIWTAVHYRIPNLIVLHNNRSFGNDEEHQIVLAEQRGRPMENAWIGQRMAAPEPDYAAIARGYGAWAEGPITDPDDLAGVFQRAVAEVERGGVALVDVQTALK